MTRATLAADPLCAEYHEARQAAEGALETLKKAATTWFEKPTEEAGKSLRASIYEYTRWCDRLRELEKRVQPRAV